MGKITSYTVTTDPEEDDYLLIDGDDGTRIVTIENAAIKGVGAINAEVHRSIYRGASLGTSITSAQQTAISDGTFDDLFVGDYWTINSKVYRIADFDYWYNIGSTYNTTAHHVVLVPDSSMYSAQMNSENTTEGAYVGSEMYTTNLADAISTIDTAFGDLLITHESYLANTVTSGYESAGAWVDSTVDLMNELMVYGTYIRKSQASASGHIATSDKHQLALFRLNPKMINRRYGYWLRDVYSSANFCNVSNVGAASNNNASISLGVRPAFAIGG